MLAIDGEELTANHELLVYPVIYCQCYRILLPTVTLA